MKYIITTLLFFLTITPAFASEVTGTLVTGVSTGNSVSGLVIAQPSANPIAGVYTSTQNIVLTGGDGSLSVHYTIDGSAATCTSGLTYSTAIPVTASLVIDAISCYANSIASPTITFGYTVNPPTAPASSGGGGGGGGGGISTAPATVTNDFNHDGRVDVFDFNILMSNWGTTSGATQLIGDATGDGAVDIFDFNLLIAGWQA